MQCKNTVTMYIPLVRKISRKNFDNIIKNVGLPSPICPHMLVEERLQIIAPDAFPYFNLVLQP